MFDKALKAVMVLGGKPAYPSWRKYCNCAVAELDIGGMYDLKFYFFAVAAALLQHLCTHDRALAQLLLQTTQKFLFR